jgi:hypothetical protein
MKSAMTAGCYKCVLMTIKLLSFFLLGTSFAYGQAGEHIPKDEPVPVYVMIAPAGADTGLEIRSAMRIKIVHMEEGGLVGYRFKDQALLASCDTEEKADAMAAKLRSWFQEAKVEKLYTKSYVNEGFLYVQRSEGRTDPTFPIYYETGDNPLDARSYRIEKLDWIANHPNAEGLPGTILPKENSK